MSTWPSADQHTPESSQRRHLTVMFCDVVGATHLSGDRDVEAYFSILHAYYNECAPVVERHGGLIAQHQGDGIYAWFGYPLPKGDDAIRAVRAGLDLLVVLRRLSAKLKVEIGEPLAVRIAVHAGEVLVTSVAGEPSPLAFGHTPNLAAKLQQAARPGTLVISAELLRLIEDSFEVIGRDPTVLADGSVVAVHEVVKERHRQGRVGRRWRTPLVGREAEQARLHRIWTSVQAGEGAVIALVGSRGIGKTRLASTVLTWAESTHAQVLDCACHHLDTGTAYRPCRTLLAQAAGIEPDDPPTVTAALLHEHLDRLGMDQLAASLLAIVLGLPPEALGPTPDLDPSKRAELTIECLVEWLTRLASTPTAVLVDDITDADPSTLNVLARLTTAPPPRLLLVCTARSDVPPPPFLARDTVEIIEVTPLAAEVSEALVDAVTTQSPLDAHERRQILTQGDGIPLFLEELARTAQEGLHRSGLPITLTGHLQARLVAPGIDREVAGALAVADRELDEPVLASVLGTDPGQLRVRLRGLLASDLVVDTGGPGSRYRFRHGLITEAAYGLLLREHRTRLHHRLAETLTRRHLSGRPVDWNVVGKHLRLAGRPLEAYEAILTGAKEAGRSGAFREALQGYHDSLIIISELTDPIMRDHLEVRCRLERGLTAIAAGGYGSAEAIEDFDRCAALCRRLGSRREHLPAILGTFSFYLAQAELTAARQVAEDLRSWVDTDHGVYRALRAFGFGCVSFFAGDYRAASEPLRLAAEHFQRYPVDDPAEQLLLPHDHTVIALAQHAILLWITGRSREARDAGERAIARAATLPFPQGPFSMAYAKRCLTWIHLFGGNYDTTARLASDVREIGQRHGFAHWEIAGEIYLALAQYRISGRPDAADTIDRQTARWELTGGRVYLPHALTAAADTRAAMGQHDDAAAGFKAAEELAQETGVYFYEAERLRLQARALSSPGEKAVAMMLAAWELAHQQGALIFELRAALDLARVAADPSWAARLDLAVQRFPPGAEYPELAEAQALLVHTSRTA
jgi:class 3 adenylate cyclase/tetratricopeptide (TPR) repeat protein